MQESTQLNNFAHDRFFYIADNRIIRHLVRRLGNPIGSQAYSVLSMFRSFCKSDDVIFVNASQKHWAEYLGMSVGCFQRAIKALEEVKLIKVNRPEGMRKLKHFTSSYALLEPDVEELFVLDELEHNPIVRFDNSLEVHKQAELLHSTVDELLKNRSTQFTQEDNHKQISDELGNILDKEDIMKSDDLQESVDAATKKRQVKKSASNPRKKVAHYISRAEKLATIVETHIKVNKKSQVSSWANNIRLLHKMDKVSLKRIDTALEWYSNNIGGDYVPQAFSGASFRSKFPNIEQAMERKDSNVIKKRVRKYEEVAKSYKQPDAVLNNDASPNPKSPQVVI